MKTFDWTWLGPNGGFLGDSDCKESAFNSGDLDSTSWRREWQPTPVFLPGEFHGQRSLARYSPWDCRVGHNSVTSTHTHTHTHTHTQGQIPNPIWETIVSKGVSFRSNNQDPFDSWSNYWYNTHWHFSMSELLELIILSGMSMFCFPPI